MPRMIEVDEAALKAKLMVYMRGYKDLKGLVVSEEDLKGWVETEINVLTGKVFVI